MADFGADLDAFRSEARAWLEENAPQSVRRLPELTIESLGGQGLGWEGDGFDKDELANTRAWLRAKANSIEGGSSEINLNVVAKRVLGLPDPKTT